jgi:hypothetical protein
MRPDRIFARFDEATMMRVARRAMPGMSIRDAVWLSDYDDYYYKTVSSFCQRAAGSHATPER